MYTETQEERDRKMAEYFSAETLAKGKKAQSPANKLTSQIVKWFISNGGTAGRVNTGGTYDAKIGKFRTSGVKKGFEDISACYPVTPMRIGLNIGVEVKIGKDRQSDDQRKRQAELESAGGVYIIAKDYDSFLKDIGEVLKKYSAG